jgi:hypothetical protein
MQLKNKSKGAAWLNTTHTSKHWWRKFKMQLCINAWRWNHRNVIYILACHIVTTRWNNGPVEIFNLFIQAQNRTTESLGSALKQLELCKRGGKLIAQFYNDVAVFSGEKIMLSQEERYLYSCAFQWEGIITVKGTEIRNMREGTPR